jgi:hypothetical protein
MSGDALATPTIRRIDSSQVPNVPERKGAAERSHPGRISTTLFASLLHSHITHPGSGENLADEDPRKSAC